ncbi:MAG: alanine aminotransferase [Candidatus Marinimicrobia bacterium]|nr:alanine aminotransferase [Candidatus Neomarinimicrobiota bacterium]|tara:strand:- start:4060 stop:5268 length:1209 start_codon:yes stop_codon:yes gene_type:complete
MKNKIPVSRRAAGIEYAIRDVVITATDLEKQGNRIIKLNIGDPLAYEGFPTPAHMVQAYQKALQEQKNGYSPSYGLPELREAIALDEQEKDKSGWSCSADDVYVTTGVTEALQVLFASFLEPGDRVLIPGPYYPPYMAYPPLFDGIVTEYRLQSDRGWRIDLSDLEAKLDDSVKLIVLINPNNPTGGIVTQDDLKQVIELVSNYSNCTIISDEIYERYNFNGSHTATASLSESVPIVTLNGVSKVFYAPGWRVGYLALHDPERRLDNVRDGIERLLRSRLCASTPAQYGYLSGLIENKDWMTSYKAKLLDRRNYCVDRIMKIDSLETQTPEGSFYMFPKILDKRLASNDKQFVLDFLHQEHVLLVHGSGFSQKLGAGHFRLVFLPQISLLEEAFDRLNRFLN